MSNHIYTGITCFKYKQDENCIASTLVYAELWIHVHNYDKTDMNYKDLQRIIQRLLYSKCGDTSSSPTH